MCVCIKGMDGYNYHLYHDILVLCYVLIEIVVMMRHSVNRYFRFLCEKVYT